MAAERRAAAAGNTHDCEGVAVLITPFLSSCWCETTLETPALLFPHTLPFAEACGAV